MYLKNQMIFETPEKLAEDIELPKGYFFKMGGQFESQEKASRMLLMLGWLSFLAIFLVKELEENNFDSLALDWYSDLDELSEKNHAHSCSM